MSRLNQIKAQLAVDESLLISNSTNIRYLSGFTGSNGLLLISKQNSHLYTDARYAIQARQEVNEFEVIISPDIWTSFAKDISSKILCVEAKELSVDRLDQILNLQPAIEIKKTKNLIESLRITKDKTEVEFISKACQISTSALNQLITQQVLGLTEVQLATKLDRLMIDLGASDKAFNTIVASGANSAIPHHQPTSKIIENGDFLKIDFGAQFNGYKSDCTRTFVLGKPANWQIEIHQAVLSGQSLGRKSAQVDMAITKLDEAVKEQIKSSGFGDYFTHGLGHGVGLDIHEEPFLSAKSDDKILENMVITIEPGIYLADRGGVRIEDTGVMTTAGYQVLTDFTYDLLELT